MKKLENKKLLLFDLDGTLINSVPDLASSVNYMLKQMNKDIFEEDIIRQWVGNGAATLVKRALSGIAIVDDFVEDERYEEALQIFLDYYENNLCQNTYLFENVKPTLEKLKKDGYILTIVTNKPYEFVQPILDTLGLKDIFQECLGANSLKKKKPDPMPLLFLCKKFNVEVSQAVMIGDSKNDIVAANNCSMQSIGVTYGYNYGEEITTYNPTKTINKFEDILNIL